MLSGWDYTVEYIFPSEVESFLNSEFGLGGAGS
jgi:hypothetical protein